jgi:hypothetical protein
MDQLWALKKEFDPFSWSGFGPGAGKFLAILRCTVYQCPYCGWPFKVTWGTGQNVCRQCELTFWDGSLEWPERNSKEQWLFLLPITIIGFVSAFLVILGLVVWESISTPEHLLFDYTASFLTFVPPLTIWFGVRAWQINRSIRRYNERGAKAL